MFVNPDLPAPQYTGVSYQRYLKKFLRTVRGVDDNVGRLLDFLEESGQLDETIIVYTADFEKTVEAFHLKEGRLIPFSDKELAAHRLARKES